MPRGARPAGARRRSPWASRRPRSAPDRALAQQAQNPSPMVEHTRAHPRLAEARPPGRREGLELGTLFVPERLASKAGTEGDAAPPGRVPRRHLGSRGRGRRGGDGGRRRPDRRRLLRLRRGGRGPRPVPVAPRGSGAEGRRPVPSGDPRRLERGVRGRPRAAATAGLRVPGRPGPRDRRHPHRLRRRPSGPARVAPRDSEARAVARLRARGGRRPQESCSSRTPRSSRGRSPAPRRPPTGSSALSGCIAAPSPAGAPWAPWSSPTRGRAASASRATRATRRRTTSTCSTRCPTCCGLTGVAGPGPRAPSAGGHGGSRPFA